MYTYLLDFTLNEQDRQSGQEMVRDRLIPMLRRNGATRVTLRRNVEESDQMVLSSEWQRQESLWHFVHGQELMRALEELRGLSRGSLRQRVMEQVSFEDLYHVAARGQQRWQPSP